MQRARRIREIVVKAVLYLALTLVTLLIIFPIIWMLSISIRPNRDVFQVPPRLIPLVFSFEGYQLVLQSSTNIRAFFNSMVVSLSVTVICVFLASLAGYGMSRFRFRGKKAVNYFILLTQMLPSILLVLPYFVIVSWLRLYDTYLALIITYCSFSLPFAMLMLRSFFDTVPVQLDEAGMIDGCTRLGSLRRLVLPVSVQGIVATGAFCFIGAWTELLFAVVLTKSANMALFTTAVAMNIGQFMRNWNSLMAISILGSVPIVLLWIFLQKYIVAGLTSGALKY
jgi:multiple sugar transport system permease protein